MKKPHFYLAVMLICLSACKKEVKTETTATDSTGVKTEAVTTETAVKPTDTAAMHKAWEVYMTPGEMHKKMAKDTGSWTLDLTFWMGPDDTKPTKSTATAETKMILNGLYQQSTNKGNMMGMPFEGISTLAYDNAAEQYISTWIDNMGSGIMILKGKYDETSKAVQMAGEIVDPVTKKPKKVRETITVIDPDTQKMEMFDTSPEGKEFKSMEIIMKRKK